MKDANRIFPLLLVLTAGSLACPLTACGGIVDSRQDGTTQRPAPAPGASGAPSVPGQTSQPAPAESPTIPATPFGPAQDVAPTAGVCNVQQPNRVPETIEQHIWKVTASGAKSIVTGNFFNAHYMNELITVGDGYLAVGTWSGGNSGLQGLAIVNEGTGVAHEALPLGPSYVRTGSYHQGRFAFGGKRSPNDPGYTIWEQSPQTAGALTVLATLPNTDYAVLRVGQAYVYAKAFDNGGAVWRIGKNGSVEPFAGATHFTWDDTKEADSLFWSVGAAIYRVGASAPIVTLNDQVMALGFDAKQKKLYATTKLGLSRFDADGSQREDLLRARTGSAGNPDWMYPTGKDEIFADNGIVRFPVNCYNNADFSDVIPYELDTNRRAGRWLTTDANYPFFEGTDHPHFDAKDAAYYTRQ